MFILEKYLKTSICQIGKVLKKRNHYQFRCNVCGDSSHNKREMRGHLMMINKSGEKFWIYKCFNAGCPAEDSWSAERWLKVYFPDLHRQYVREILETKSFSNIIVEEKPEPKQEVKPKKPKQEYKFISVNAKHTDSYNMELIRLAKEMKDKRKIPNEIFSKWFVCSEGTYRGRVIIPFYDNQDKIYYFQARSLDGRIPKYINKLDTRDKALYNIFNVDRNKPVIITEGPIDSMFIENAIAVTGLTLSENVRNILSGFDCYWLLDNDESGRKKSKEYLLQGKKVFMWKKLPNSQDCKDINDYVLKIGKEKLTQAELLPYFTDNVYDGVFL